MNLEYYITYRETKESEDKIWYESNSDIISKGLLDKCKKNLFHREEKTKRFKKLDKVITNINEILLKEHNLKITGLIEENNLKSGKMKLLLSIIEDEKSTKHEEWFLMYKETDNFDTLFDIIKCVTVSIQMYKQGYVMINPYM